MSWQIKGEAGKNLDATPRRVPDLRIAGVTLKFSSLAGDQLTWTASTDNATGAGTIVPDAGQVVELWHDGVRKFRGHATSPRIGLKSIQVTVEGPWWWMTRIQLTEFNGSCTVPENERPCYVFPTQDLATSVAALITRAIANGVPVTLGTIAAMYAVPKITLSNMDCGSALAEILRWVPDAVAWFDYTATDSATLPTLNVTRRGTYAPVALAIGIDLIETLELAPRLDLEVQQSDLNYVTRNPTTGAPAWALQSYGNAAAGQRQMIAISGPEIATLLPKDDFETVALTSVHWSALTAAFIIDRDSTLSGIKSTYGTVYGAPAGFVNPLASYYYGQQGNKSRGWLPLTGWSFKTTTGKTLPLAQRYFVTSLDTLPDWAKTLIGAEEVTVTGTWLGAWFDSVNGAGAWAPAFMAQRAASGTQVLTGWENDWISGPGSLYQVDYAWLPFTFTGWMISDSYPALTTLYKPWDYDYLTPPAGLAQNLQAAQNWVPYEGKVVLVADAVTGDNNVKNALNLTGTLPPCATMAAMTRSVTYDLMRGRTTYDLGTPARTDFGSLVARVRRDPKDNIVYL